MITSKVIYLGELRTEMTHLQSGTVIFTDAPKDNHGKGEAFSPTDLVASALGSCMISIVGIKLLET
ncbi:MAG TPA: OsmC family peroxiredoxin, partial [Chitinophagales bacterium]|nr:OsmC family peroxiredoxin [Chitinophagales bacterium]